MTGCAQRFAPSWNSQPMRQLLSGERARPGGAAPPHQAEALRGSAPRSGCGRRSGKQPVRLRRGRRAAQSAVCGGRGGSQSCWAGFVFARGSAQAHSSQPYWQPRRGPGRAARWHRGRCSDPAPDPVVPADYPARCSAPPGNWRRRRGKAAPPARRHPARSAPPRWPVPGS